MGFEKRTLKIILSVIAILLITGGSLGLLFAFLLYQPPYIELEVWPRPADDGQRIWFRADDPDTWHPWVRRINELIGAYATATPEDPPNAPCSTHAHYEDLQRSANCAHAMRYWTPCTIDTYYGYIRGTPCVFLKLSHIEQWTPRPYNISVDLPLPPEMPQHLKEGLNHPSAKHEDYIWVSCQADEDAGIRYIPENLPPGFPARRLRTADRTEADLADEGPLLAMMFQNLTRGIVINVECRIWTRDIVYDANTDIGRTRFEILID